MSNLKFHEYLEKNKNKKFFVDWCKGNNGDLLISKGLSHILNQMEVCTVSDIDDCDIVIINGGGMFVDGYKQGISKLNKYLDEKREVCVAPNSFNYKKFDFEGFLKQYDTKVTLFARETYSYNLLKNISSNLEHVECYISDDLAFYLENSDFINDIKLNCQKYTGKILVVDRMDIENKKNGGKVTVTMKLYNKMFPELLKNIYRSLRNWRRGRFGTHMTKFAKNIVLNNNPDYKINEITSTDLSRDDIYSFDEFVMKISESDYIFTNRLHVGVLGYLLNKKVFLVEGAYFKLTGIYELSMKHSCNTKLLSKYEPEC
ncbi:polysaccharide pyruvyl transferase family protein [Vibrio parahaemolyticus]|nr:polysaccharide pyruvyl transferase family protein [Vibrio parahaemolyticus]HAS6628207.1 hypothetical protein [Vibrio parahaemolyticus]